MKYVYLDLSAADRIVCICKQHSNELAANFEEYIVSDIFDLDLIMHDDNGIEVRVPGAIPASEFLSRYISSYVDQRITSYPAISEQLDMLWHAMNSDETKRLEPFYSSIKSVKDRFPKP
jgi:hypothetical protein